MRSNQNIGLQYATQFTNPFNVHCVIESLAVVRQPYAIGIYNMKAQIRRIEWSFNEIESGEADRWEESSLENTIL